MASWSGGAATTVASASASRPVGGAGGLLTTTIPTGWGQVGSRPSAFTAVPGSYQEPATASRWPVAASSHWVQPAPQQQGGWEGQWVNAMPGVGMAVQETPRQWGSQVTGPPAGYGTVWQGQPNWDQYGNWEGQPAAVTNPGTSTQSWWPEAGTTVPVTQASTDEQLINLVAEAVAGHPQVAEEPTTREKQVIPEANTSGMETSKRPYKPPTSPVSSISVDVGSVVPETPEAPRQPEEEVKRAAGLPIVHCKGDVRSPNVVVIPGIILPAAEEVHPLNAVRPSGRGQCMSTATPTGAAVVESGRLTWASGSCARATTYAAQQAFKEQVAKVLEKVDLTKEGREMNYPMPNPTIFEHSPRFQGGANGRKRFKDLSKGAAELVVHLPVVQRALSKDESTTFPLDTRNVTARQKALVLEVSVLLIYIL